MSKNKTDHQTQNKTKQKYTQKPKNKQKHNKAESSDLPGKEYMPVKVVSQSVKCSSSLINGYVFFMSVTPEHTEQHFTYRK